MAEQIQAALHAAHAALRRGALQEARARLAAAGDHPQALHLGGLVERAAGRLESAADLLRRAAEALPHDAEIACNQGLVARQRGDLPAAETAFRRALALQPDFLPAALGFGRTLIDSRQWSAAHAHYTRLLEALPDNVAARYGWSTVQLERGRTEAAEAGFDALVSSGDTRAGIRFMRGRARLELGRIGDGLADLQAACAAEPTPRTVTTLAGALWMAGAEEAFDQFLGGAAARPELLVTVAELRRQSGAPEQALAMLDDAGRRISLPPDADAVRALCQVDRGEAGAAEQAARRCLAADPASDAARAGLASALLMQGRARDTLEFLAPLRAREPHRQHWLAYEATALRLLGDPRHGELFDMEKLVRVYELPTPPDFADLATFNEALQAALDRWHVYPARPLDQSLRNGSQTPRDLSGIDEPVIRSYLQALQEPVRQYLRDVGSDPEHPLTRRNGRGFHFAGCWSVKLFGGGHHVNHVHPEGWISSAYYVAVPRGTAAGERAGWIRFGQPPFPTEPETPPERWIEPRAGRLVLFPSYLWHGTAPTPPDTVRMTAPFDVVPGPAP